MTAQQALEQLQQLLRDDEDALGFLDIVAQEFEDWMWPDGTFAAAKEAFGPAVFNRDSRTYKVLNLRIRHCLRSWRDKYGDLTPAQEQYADEVMAAAIRNAVKEAGGDGSKRYAFAQAQLTRMVNHEQVDAGFRRRSERKQRNLDELVAA